MTFPEILEIHKRVGDVYHRYYSLPECVPTEENFKLWLDSLRDPMFSCFKSMGFENCVLVLNYRRFILELNDIGLNKYLEDNLSKEDYEYVMTCS